jgi:hypothetical protein
MNLKQAKSEAQKLGLELYRPDEVPQYSHYKTGYIAYDGTQYHRWERLGDFVTNCIEEKRGIDGFMRR